MQPLGSSTSSSTSAALRGAQQRQRCRAAHARRLPRGVPLAAVAVAHERALKAQPRAKLVDHNGDAPPVLRAQHVRHQCALPRAQEAGDERHLRREHSAAIFNSCHKAARTGTGAMHATKARQRGTAAQQKAVQDRERAAAAENRQQRSEAHGVTLRSHTAPGYGLGSAKSCVACTTIITGSVVPSMAPSLPAVPPGALPQPLMFASARATPRAPRSAGTLRLCRAGATTTSHHCIALCLPAPSASAKLRAASAAVVLFPTAAAVAAPLNPAAVETVQQVCVLQSERRSDAART